MEAVKQQADVLIERILSDARADAAKVQAEADLQIAAVLSERDKKLAALRLEAADKRTKAVSGVIDGCRTRAELDGRKAALAAKRERLDAAFLEAEQALIALPKEKRGNILSKLLLAEAEPNCGIRPAKADREALAGMLTKLPFAAHMDEADALITGGFLVVGDGYEKDCSFHALMTLLREREESGAAQLLFA